MSQPIPIIMFGAAGRMGRMILTLAADDTEHYRIVGAVERPDHPQIGQGLDQLFPGGPDGVPLTDRPPEEIQPATVAIHFTLPEAIHPHMDWTRRLGVGSVIGTTGLDPAQRSAIESAAAAAPILLTPNTSLGVNVLFWLAQQAAGLLGPDYDIEITEMHHHHKMDAPSGTARRLAEVMLEVRGGRYDRDMRHGRQGQVGRRPPSEIGMHALRGGDVAGDHTVVLAGSGERLELTHRAHSRELFARGALKAAAWLSQKNPGLYSMNDMLGL